MEIDQIMPMIVESDYGVYGVVGIREGGKVCCNCSSEARS